MQLTEEQKATKHAIIERLLAVKQNSYHNMMNAQQADLGNAEEVNENSENLFEDGKVDQSINRVEARSQTVEALKRDIDILSNLEVIDPTEEIQLGDLIETDKGYFFVAVPTDEIEVDGMKVRGISTRSPLFQALMGKHNGDSVEVNGNSFKLINSY